MMPLRPLLAVPPLVLALLGAGYYEAITPSSQLYGRMVVHGPRDRPVVALTFDDGPNGEWTLAVAGLLEERGVRGTFFVVGENVDADPRTLRQLVERGHLVGNHSYHHRKRDALLDPSYAEVARAEAAIHRAAGVCPALFRPPNGFHTPWQLRAVARHGLVAVTWDVQPSDWKGPPPQELARRVVEAARPGSIVLLHDGLDTRQGVDRSRLLAALPAIVDGLLARGFRLVRLDELLGVAPYLPDCSWAEGA
ncbi:MAG TPA: polysaccharide deacetylase family protein [Dehalococcoidia bacterium]|nr:polysaccharide deacetylase family protein [Dehalococcoidia bacterium]